MYLFFQIRSIVSLLEKSTVWGTFFITKAFHGETFLRKFMRFVLQDGTIDQIMPKEVSFTNAFSSNLNTVNPENLLQPWWYIHLKIRP